MHLTAQALVGEAPGDAGPLIRLLTRDNYSAVGEVDSFPPGNWLKLTSYQLAISYLVNISLDWI